MARARWRVAVCWGEGMGSWMWLFKGSVGTDGGARWRCLCGRVALALAACAFVRMLRGLVDGRRAAGWVSNGGWGGYGAAARLRPTSWPPVVLVRLHRTSDCTSASRVPRLVPKLPAACWATRWCVVSDRWGAADPGRAARLSLAWRGGRRAFDDDGLRTARSVKWCRPSLRWRPGLTSRQSGERTAGPGAGQVSDDGSTEMQCGPEGD